MLHYATNILINISLQKWLAFSMVSLVVLLGDKVWNVLSGRSISFPLAYKLSGIYLAFILLVTLFTREIGSGGELAWMPLWSWREVLRHHNWRLLWQILLNILLFVPLGGLLAMNRSLPTKAILLSGFGLSLCIELCQLVFRLGLFEWDDVLHNGLGCVLGVVGVKLIQCAVRICTTRKNR